MDGWMVSGWMDGWRGGMSGWTDRWMVGGMVDGWMNRGRDGWMEFYRHITLFLSFLTPISNTFTQAEFFCTLNLIIFMFMSI